MQIVHFRQSCVLVEIGTARLLLDPGIYSEGFDELTGLDAILVTHQHPDHLDLARMPALLAANPAAQLLVDSGSAPQLAGAGIAHQVVGPGQQLELAGTTVEVIGDVVGLAAVAVAIMVVARITERFDQIREETIAQVPPAPYYPQAPPAAHSPAYPPPPQQYQPYPSPPPQYAQPQQPAQAPPPPVAASPQPPTEQRIQCPDCAEWIQAQANVCRFCGHRLRPLGQ